MTTQHSAAKSSTRPDIKVPVPFSSGTLTLKVYFAGGFSELSGRARDTILGSATTALLQFPTLLHQSTTGDSQHSDQSRGYGTDPAQGERQQDSETREARTTISNEYGQITVELVLENATVRVPEQIIRALNGTTASAVLNYATAAITGTPAVDDAFMQLVRGWNKAEEARTGEMLMDAGSSLVGTGTHSSR